jgi:hypothetical protein
MRKGSRIFNLLCLGLIVVNFMFISIASADITTGLVAYYPFNGNANDESGNGNNGTVYGATLSTDRFGNPNSAYYFDGINDYIKASANNLPNGERTVSLWFNAPIVSNNPVFLGYGGSSTCGTSWFMGVGPYYFVTSHCDVNLLKYYYPQEPIGAWYHYVVTTGSNWTKIYINGVEKASNTTFINNTVVTGTDLSIGVDVNTQGFAPYTDPNVGYFVGSMDDVRIYNRALSDTDIQELYNEGNSPDLIVTKIKNIPNHKKRGGKFTVKDVVLNQGDAAAGPFINAYYLSIDEFISGDDIEIEGSRNILSLDVGESSKKKPVKVRIPVDTPLGKYYLIVCADNEDQIAESDETNNCMASKKKIKVHK